MLTLLNVCTRIFILHELLSIHRNACLSDVWKLQPFPSKLRLRLRTLIYYMLRKQFSDWHSCKTQNYYHQCNDKIPKHGGREPLTTLLFEAGAKRMESESMRPPKCNIGGSKHQHIGKCRNTSK